MTASWDPGAARDMADRARRAQQAVNDLGAGQPPVAAEPRRWMYGLTADEWFHLAAEGQDSEVAPCCGQIGEFREWLNALATCQGEGEAYILLTLVLGAYESAAADHDTLRDAASFPLLHRVLGGIRAQQSADPLPPARTPEPEAGL